MYRITTWLLTLFTTKTTAAADGIYTMAVRWLRLVLTRQLVGILGDEVITHEMQHIMPFAGHSYLGDEYEDNTYCAIYDTIPISYKDCPNFTSDTVNGRKWQDWINDGVPGVGFYDSAGICAGNYRPTELCAMRSVFIIINDDNFLGMPPFCPVWLAKIPPLISIALLIPFTIPVRCPTSYTGTYTLQRKGGYAGRKYHPLSVVVG